MAADGIGTTGARGGRTSGPRLLTVVLNYKTPEMTLEAVRAAHAEMAGIAGAIVVVDNDSGDGSYERLAAAVAAEGWDAQGRVRVVQSGRNGGFGAGNNAGIRAGLPGGLRPDYAYILNSDALPHDGAIAKLLAHLEAHPEVGFAGSYIHGPGGEPHTTLFRFPTVASEFEGAARFGPVSRALARYRVPREIPAAGAHAVDWLAGASLMMRLEALEAVGLFDERFFLYFEETDLCRRAWAAGWPVVYLRESEVSHIGSVSTGMKRWTRIPGYWLDSRQHYFAKTHGVGTALAATLAHLAGGLIWQLRRAVERKPRADPPWFLWDMAAHAVRYWGGRALGRRRGARGPAAASEPPVYAGGVPAGPDG